MQDMSWYRNIGLASSDAGPRNLIEERRLFMRKKAAVERFTTALIQTESPFKLVDKRRVLLKLTLWSKCLKNQLESTNQICFITNWFLHMDTPLFIAKQRLVYRNSVLIDEQMINRDEWVEREREREGGEREREWVRKVRAISAFWRRW